jgi:hypothetical protein
MLGTIWTALAPEPMTATLLPERSIEGSHADEWSDVPLKLARPGKAGTDGHRVEHWRPSAFIGSWSVDQTSSMITEIVRATHARKHDIDCD